MHDKRSCMTHGSELIGRCTVLALTLLDGGASRGQTTKCDQPHAPRARSRGWSLNRNLRTGCGSVASELSRSMQGNPGKSRVNKV